MSSRPEVTLVMPVWRPQRAWFLEAIGSALGQTGCDLELVVVDDGSEEPVAALLDGINDPRLRLLRIEHGGRSAACNAGTADARGSYVRYIDGDDVFASDGTRRLLDAVDEHTIAHASTMVCDEALDPAYEIRSDLEGNVEVDCLLSRFDVRHVSMLFPIDVVRAAGSWDPAISNCQDWDFVLRCVERAPVRATPEVVTSYRRHAESTTRNATASEGARRGQSRVIEKYFHRHPEARGTPLAREAWTVHHRTWARRALHEGAVRAFLEDAVALTRLAPRAAVSVWTEAARRGVRRVARLGISAPG